MRSTSQAELKVAITLSVMRRCEQDALSRAASLARALVSRSKRTRLAWRSCLGMLGLFVIGALTVRAAHADKFPLASGIPHSVPERLRPKLQALAQENADNLYTDLLLRTDEVARICSLSEEETARLELAAKGAVQQAIDDLLNRTAVEFAENPGGVVAMILAMRIAGGPRAVGHAVEVLGNGRRHFFIKNGNVLAWREDVAAGADAHDPSVEVMEETAVLMAGGFHGLAATPLSGVEQRSLWLDSAVVVEASLWTTTRDRLLTDAQRRKLEHVEIRRQQYFNQHEFQLEQAVNYIDQELLLDSRQRERITNLCTSFARTHSTIQDGTALAMMALKTLPAVEMAELLSDRQQSRLREIVDQNKVPGRASRGRVLPDVGIDSRKGLIR